MIEQRFTDGAHWQEAAGYSRAVRSGSHIAVSGTTASAPDGSASTGSPGSDRLADTYQQTLDALRRGVHAVQELGGRVEDVLRTRVYLVPGTDWRAAARAHREVFDTVRPANTMLYVHSLVGDDLLVEVEIEAEVGGDTDGDGAAGASTAGDGTSAAGGAGDGISVAGSGGDDSSTAGPAGEVAPAPDVSERSGDRP
jgi:enamine deaminase RidA (YjgF/YER057c/UK114 family)